MIYDRYLSFKQKQTMNPLSKEIKSTVFPFLPSPFSISPVLKQKCIPKIWKTFLYVFPPLLALRDQKKKIVKIDVGLVDILKSFGHDGGAM